MRNLLVKILILFSILITIQTIYATNVKRLIAETDDGVVFTIWSQESVIKLNQDMVFHYNVKNNGAKSIYLVTEQKPKIFVESYLISVAKPFPSEGVNSPLFKLNYRELKKGGALQEKIIVPFNKFKLEKLWTINFGFVYVLDKNGLDRELEFYKDPQSLIGEFNQRAITIDLCSLEVSVRK